MFDFILFFNPSSVLQRLKWDISGGAPRRHRTLSVPLSLAEVRVDVNDSVTYRLIVSGILCCGACFVSVKESSAFEVLLSSSGYSAELVTHFRGKLFI